MEHLQFPSGAQDIEGVTHGRLRVLVADDHPVVRGGVVAAIRNQSDMCVVAEAQDGREAVAKVIANRADVYLLDLRMPQLDGIQATKAILEQQPAARVVILSSYQTQEDVYRALEAGAKGYVLKEAPLQEIIDSLRAVASGNTWIPSEVGIKLATRIADKDLTPRENDVLRELAVGKSNKEIGVRFDISEATVKVHVTHILQKLKVTGRMEALAAAAKRGLVRLG